MQFLRQRLPQARPRYYLDPISFFQAAVAEMSAQDAGGGHAPMKSDRYRGGAAQWRGWNGQPPPAGTGSA